MKTVMVASTKGGTAKTTTALALAAAWAAAHQRRIAVWDGDPQGTLTRQLRHAVIRDPWAAAPVALEIPRIAGRVELFRGGRALGLAALPEIERFFRRPEWAGRGGTDLGVIDTPPGGLLHIVAAAGTADLLLVPVDTTPLGLEGLIETMDLLRAIDPPLPTRVLLTRVVARRGITREITDYLDRRHPGIRLPVGIPEDARVPESHKERRPVTLGVQSRAADAYHEVARHLLAVIAGIRRVPHGVDTAAVAGSGR